MIKYNSEDLVNHHGVSAVIKNNKGDILMQNHVKYGFWTIPVGKVKKNQTVIDGLKEEVFEECNINILNHKELNFTELKYIRDGNKVTVLNHIYEVLEYIGEVKNNEPHKHSEQIFLSIEEIVKKPYLSDATILFLETLGINREV